MLCDTPGQVRKKSITANARLRISAKKQAISSKRSFFAFINEKIPHICWRLKEKYYFCPEIKNKKKLMKSFNFAYYFFFYFYFSHKVEREFVCVK